MENKWIFPFFIVGVVRCWETTVHTPVETLLLLTGGSDNEPPTHCCREPVFLYFLTYFGGTHFVSKPSLNIVTVSSLQRDLLRKSIGLVSK